MKKCGFSSKPKETKSNSTEKYRGRTSKRKQEEKFSEILLTCGHSLRNLNFKMLTPTVMTESVTTGEVASNIRRHRSKAYWARGLA